MGQSFRKFVQSAHIQGTVSGRGLEASYMCLEHASPSGCKLTGGREDRETKTESDVETETGG